MNFLEADLEEIIYKSEPLDLQQKGLYIQSEGKLFRQLKIGNYGISDLINVSRFSHGYDSFLCVDIYELKKEKVGVSAFFQSLKYARGIQRYFESRGFDSFILNIFLIGRTIDVSGELCYLPDLLNNLDLSNGVINRIIFQTYEYDLNGLKFKIKNGFKLVDEGFNISGSQKRKDFLYV